MGSTPDLTTCLEDKSIPRFGSLPNLSRNRANSETSEGSYVIVSDTDSEKDLSSTDDLTEIFLNADKVIEPDFFNVKISFKRFIRKVQRQFRINTELYQIGLKTNDKGLQEIQNNNALTIQHVISIMNESYALQ